MSPSTLLELERALSDAPVSDLPALMRDYDLQHRLQRHAQPDAVLMARCRRRVIDAWLHDAATFSDGIIYALIGDQLRDRRAVAPLDDALIRWYCDTTRRWCTELRYLDRFTRVPAAESALRLRCLLREDLSLYWGSEERARKQRWRATLAGSAPVE